MSEAEGSFPIVRRVDKRALLGFNIYFRFIIDQKNEEQLLEKIQSCFVYGYLQTRKKVLSGGKKNKVVFTSRPSILKCAKYLKK